ncbi:collagen alpha-1(I) chain-like [Passer domesticus]|uniref:collagen alpha-1(I) chain-like n=1 Tax=Passer domesticus TaxID=48849 RepID=UPI0030FE65E7
MPKAAPSSLCPFRAAGAFRAPFWAPFSPHALLRAAGAPRSPPCPSPASAGSRPWRRSPLSGLPALGSWGTQGSAPPGCLCRQPPPPPPDVPPRGLFRSASHFFILQISPPKKNPPQPRDPRDIWAELPLPAHLRHGGDDPTGGGCECTEGSAACFLLLSLDPPLALLFLFLPLLLCHPPASSSSSSSSLCPPLRPPPSSLPLAPSSSSRSSSDPLAAPFPEPSQPAAGAGLEPAQLGTGSAGLSAAPGRCGEGGKPARAKGEANCDNWGPPIRTGPCWGACLGTASPWGSSRHSRERGTLRGSSGRSDPHSPRAGQADPEPVSAIPACTLSEHAIPLSQDLCQCSSPAFARLAPPAPEQNSRSVSFPERKENSERISRHGKSSFLPRGSGEGLLSSAETLTGPAESGDAAPAGSCSGSQPPEEPTPESFPRKAPGAAEGKELSGEPDTATEKDGDSGGIAWISRV